MPFDALTPRRESDIFLQGGRHFWPPRPDFLTFCPAPAPGPADTATRPGPRPNTRPAYPMR